jgi:hypothetical protein
MDLTMMERVVDRWEKMEGYCSTGQSPQRAVVPVEEEEEEEEKELFHIVFSSAILFLFCLFSVCFGVLVLFLCSVVCVFVLSL